MIDIGGRTANNYFIEEILDVNPNIIAENIRRIEAAKLEDGAL